MTTWDVAADKRNTDLWKIKWDGSGQSQLDVLAGERVVCEVES